MIEFYVTAVNLGFLPFSRVPEFYRDEVTRRLKALNEPEEQTEQPAE